MFWFGLALPWCHSRTHGCQVQSIVLGLSWFGEWCFLSPTGLFSGLCCSCHSWSMLLLACLYCTACTVRLDCTALDALVLYRMLLYCTAVLRSMLFDAARFRLTNSTEISSSKIRSGCSSSDTAMRQRRSFATGAVAATQRRSILFDGPSQIYAAAMVETLRRSFAVALRGELSQQLFSC